MNSEKIFLEKRTLLEGKIQFLADKPEETVDSTLMALWFAASGVPKSITEATKYPLPQLTKQQLKLLDELIIKRLNGTPVAHITGRQNFMGIELISDSRALIPRRETELLGWKALELSLLVSSTKGRTEVFDLCCGSGNLGLGLAYHNASSIIHASDISLDAISLARENIELLNLKDRVKVEQSDLFEVFNSDQFYNKVDIIVCNPPYISSFKVSKMDPEISNNEPSLAFDGGMIGLRIIQRLISESAQYLVPHKGWLLFEVGIGQGELIIEFSRRANHYQRVESISDSSGNIRVILLQKK
jgi:release factor glutamine methyltransferase